jgi:hypothetical protein
MSKNILQDTYSIVRGFTAYAPHAKHAGSPQGLPLVIALTYGFRLRATAFG